MKISGMITRGIYAVLMTTFLLTSLAIGIPNQSNMSADTTNISTNTTNISTNMSNINMSNINMSNINMSNATSDIYSVDVDQDYGFYRVIDMKKSGSVPYDKNNRTLTINVGDTVIWKNDATPDEPLTIISKEGLWGNRSAYLRWNYQKFSYTFNQSGTYGMYIKEYPREQHQTVIVKDIVTPSVTISTTPTTNIVLPNSPIGEETPVETISSKKEEQSLMEGAIAIIALIVLIIYISRKK